MYESFVCSDGRNGGQEISQGSPQATVNGFAMCVKTKSAAIKINHERLIKLDVFTHSVSEGSE